MSDRNEYKCRRYASNHDLCFIWSTINAGIAIAGLVVLTSPTYVRAEPAATAMAVNEASLAPSQRVLVSAEIAVAAALAVRRSGRALESQILEIDAAQDRVTQAAARARTTRSDAERAIAEAALVEARTGFETLANSVHRQIGLAQEELAAIRADAVVRAASLSPEEVALRQRFADGDNGRQTFDQIEMLARQRTARTREAAARSIGTDQRGSARRYAGALSRGVAGYSTEELLQLWNKAATTDPSEFWQHVERSQLAQITLDFETITNAAADGARHANSEEELLEALRISLVAVAMPTMDGIAELRLPESLANRWLAAVNARGQVAFQDRKGAEPLKDEQVLVLSRFFSGINYVFSGLEFSIRSIFVSHELDNATRSAISLAWVDLVKDSGMISGAAEPLESNNIVGAIFLSSLVNAIATTFPDLDYEKELSNEQVLNLRRIAWESELIDFRAEVHSQDPSQVMLTQAIAGYLTIFIQMHLQRPHDAGLIKDYTSAFLQTFRWLRLSLDSNEGRTLISMATQLLDSFQPRDPTDRSVRNQGHWVRLILASEAAKHGNVGQALRWLEDLDARLDEDANVPAAAFTTARYRFAVQRQRAGLPGSTVTAADLTATVNSLRRAGHSTPRDSELVRLALAPSSVPVRSSGSPPASPEASSPPP